MIPGPNESKDKFLKRQALFLAAADKLQKKYPNRTITTVDGFPVFIGKKGLKPWEAGALWIYENDEGIRVPLIQLKTWNEEVFAHEKIHAERIAFDDPKFEEILAYLSSKKKWRQIFGPFFRSQPMIWTCLTLSVLPMVHPGFIVLLSGFLLIEGIRLFYVRNQLMKVMKKLGSFEKTLFLTDQEIALFAKESQEGIISYLQSCRQGNLRICKLLQLMS